MFLAELLAQDRQVTQPEKRSDQPNVAIVLQQCLADAAGIAVPEQDRCVRALLLELERLYNHVADIGALAGDVGFALAAVQAQRLRESRQR